MHFTADIPLHLHDVDTPRILAAIQHLKDTLMASQAELLVALTTANDSITSIGIGVDKIGTETEGLQKAVADLTAALGNVQTTPEVDAALATLQASVASVASRVKAVDDLVPDAPVTP